MNTGQFYACLHKQNEASFSDEENLQILNFCYLFWKEMGKIK